MSNYNQAPNGNYGQAPNGNYGQAPNGNYGQNQQQGQYNRPLSIVQFDRRSTKQPDGSYMNAPLDQISMAVVIRPGENGDHLALNFGSRDGRSYIRMNFNLKFNPNMVADVFGQELAREDGVVDFTVFLNEYHAKKMLERPPRATQFLLVMVTGMKQSSYTDRNGNTRMSITGYATGFSRLGTTKKRDGTDSKPMVIFGAENADNNPGQGGYNQAPNGGYNQAPNGGYNQAPNGGYNQAPNGGYSQVPGVTTFQEMDDDEELPF